MKKIFLYFTLILISNSAYALTCGALFVSKPQNRELQNSLKRIRNYQTFSTAVMINTISQRMTVVVFDFPNRGNIGERESLNDHAQELQSFASEMRALVDNNTEGQLLLKRLEMENHPENHLSVQRPTENSKDYDYELEVFKSVDSWISKDGPKLNVLILPEKILNNFMLTAAHTGNYFFKTLDKIIDDID